MKSLKNALLLKKLYHLRHLGYRYTSLTPYTQEHSSMTLPNTLEALTSQLTHCHLCQRSKSRNAVIVAQGSQPTALMIIGDMPSSDDDAQGEIFVGKSGELLTKMIENVLNIPREKVYLTNLLKCHSIQNQIPIETEIDICKSYLLQEIALVQPKLIITLGELAYQHLSGDTTPLNLSRGKLQQKASYTLLATLHPDYLLRNPSLKREVFEDLKRAKAFLDTI